MKNGIDHKGSILTSLSEFWFDLLTSNDKYKIPNLKTHYVSRELPSKLQQKLPSCLVSQLLGRSMVVRRLKVLPIESIVRGYITGSAWVSYKMNGTVCGIQMPLELQESQKLQRPLWTPSTKAEVGGVDENISPSEGELFFCERCSSFYLASILVCKVKVLTGFVVSRHHRWKGDCRTD